jgi:hypothetical protein
VNSIVKRKLIMMVVAFILAYFGDQGFRSFACGTVFAWIWWGIAPRMPHGWKSDFEHAGAEDFGKDGPDEGDGPWAEGFEDRCGEEYLKESFRRSRRLLTALNQEID